MEPSSDSDWLNGQELGRWNEDRVEDALKKMRVSGDIFDYYRCERGGELDAGGIDFLVFPEQPNWLVGLQVKSSYRERHKHIIRYGKHIPCVVVDRGDDDATIHLKVLQELSLYTGPLEDHLEEVMEDMRKDLMLS